MRTARGFTLVELLVVVTLIGILAALAAPSFNETILAQRVKSTSFDFIASLSYARGEAIKRNGSVRIEPIGGDWASGWETIAADDTTLRSQSAATNITITGPLPKIVYGRSGRVIEGTGNIEIDDNQSSSTVQPRCITLDPAGIPRSRQGACPL